MLIYERPERIPGTFAIIPTAALHDQRLSPTAKTVLAVASSWNPARMSSFSQRSVAELLGVGKDAVRAAFDNLCAAGYLSRSRRGRVSVYRLHLFHTSQDSQRSPEATSVSDGGFSDAASAVAADIPSSDGADNPPTYYLDASQKTSSAPPGRPVDVSDSDALHRREEEGMSSSQQVSSSRPCSADSSASGSPDSVQVLSWCADLVAALPLGARPKSLPRRLRLAALRWVDTDPQVLAEVISATLPATVLSPAGLLTAKLADIDQVQVAAAASARREPSGGPPPPPDPPADPAVVAARVAGLRAQLGVPAPVAGASGPSQAHRSSTVSSTDSLTASSSAVAS